MSIPRIDMNFADGGLGIIPAGAGGAQAKVGVSLSGTPNTVYPVATDAAAVAALGGGPLCEATAAITGVAGTTVYAVPCTIVTAGSVSAWTQTGTGAGVVSSTVGPHVQIVAKVSTAGTLGTAAFQFSVNGGAYGTPVVSTASSFPYRVPGTFCTMTFAAGTYVIDTTYTVDTSGTVTKSETAIDTVTQVSSPVDAYRLQVTITLAGARGTAQFTYSLDDGNVVSPSILTAATYVIPGTGIKLAFTNASYVLGDIYTATATPPATDNTAIGLAINALTASTYTFECVHVVGAPATSALTATLATAVDAKMTTAETNQRYIFGVLECPQGEGDSTIASAFTGFASTHGRIVIDCGDIELISTVTGLTMRRNGAWALCARMAGSKLSENPGKVLLGALPNVASLFRDEYQTPALTDARLVTQRTLLGKIGYFITDGVTMAQTTSDYATIMNVRVVDRAAQVAAAGFTDYINADVRVNATTGYIDERDALKIDTNITAQLRAALMGNPGTATDEVSDVSAAISRTDNLLSSPIATATVSIVPKAYLRTITVTIGFRNPVLG